jgi:hypothetical protein
MLSVHASRIAWVGGCFNGHLRNKEFSSLVELSLPNAFPLLVPDAPGGRPDPQGRLSGDT